MPDSKNEAVRTFLKAAPKAELHIHIEATIRPETLFHLVRKNNIDPEIKSPEDIQSIFKFRNLSEFIGIFLYMQKCFKENEDFGLLFDDAKKYFIDNNVKYAEMFFAPTTFLKYGFKYDEILDILDRRIEDTRNKDGIDIRMIIDVSRTFGAENAAANLALVEHFRTPNVIGIGLGGDERLHPSDDFITVFNSAKKAGLHSVCHAGEDMGPKSVWGALKLLEAERIGHGISAMEDSELMDYLIEKQIPLEICPTSNLYTAKYVTQMKYHPVRMFFKRGLLTTVNSDDPIFFNTDISNELYELYDKLSFSVDELAELILMGARASFHPEKDNLAAGFRTEIEALRKTHHV